jgi:hypothetical protein
LIKNKTTLVLSILVCLGAILGCKQAAQVFNTSKTADSDNDNDVPSVTRNDGRSTYTAAGKEWQAYDLEQTDIKIELPGKPGDKTPQLPPAYKQIFSAMRIYALDDNDFSVSASELAPTGKRMFTVKELADTSMTAFKRQIPDLKYDLDLRSESNAKYNGSFTKNGKQFDLRGCCIYKKTKPARVWAILTFYPKDNSDAQAAGKKALDSVVFNGSTEECP